jgi:uncharacterized protein YggE
MKRALYVGVGSFILAGLCFADEPSQKPKREIVVQGQGKILAEPDMARVWIEVDEEGLHLDAVSQEVRRKINDVLKVLKDQNIAPKDIQTESYHVAPKLEWKNGKTSRAGYTVSNQVMVQVHDLKKTGVILAEALDAGANRVNGPQFEFENPQALERKALVLALEDAKAKAALLAETAGATLGEVVSIQEGSTALPGPLQPRAFGALSAASAGLAKEEPISPGEQTIQAMVTAAFALK